MGWRSKALLLAALSLTGALAVAQSPVVQGQRVTIEVQVTDESGSPLPEVTVHFLDETDGVELGAGETDPDGRVSVVWDTAQATPGVHTILIWIEEADYVETAQARISLEILAPAELSLSVSSPAAVRPGMEFTLRATVSNAGQAAAQDVEVKLGQKSKGLGDLPGGASSTAEFSLKAPDEPGDYDLTVKAVGIEWGTSRALSVSSTVRYHVKMEGIALEIRAPYSVREGEQFTLSLGLSNVGEEPVSLSISINLSGARPDRIEDSVTLDPGASITRAYFATAGEVSGIRVIALAEGGGLRASDEATIAVIPAPPPSTPPAPRPTPTETTPPSTDSTLPPPTPSTARQAPSSAPPSGHAVTLEVNVTPNTGVRPNASFSLKGASAAGSSFVLAVLAVLRGLWRVEDP